VRVQPQDLSHHLNSTLSSLYFIFGEETLLQWEALETIRAQSHQQGYTERERFDISIHFNWEAFKTNLNALSLFASRRLIECHLTEDKISKTTSENLIKVVSNIPPDTILLLFIGKLESNSLKSTWFSTLEKKGITIEARPLTKGAFVHWLKNRIAHHQLQLTEEALDTLLERTEGNLSAAAQTIEKLSLYSAHDKAPFQTETIRHMVSNETRFSIFDLIDALLKGSIERTKLIFWSLKNEGTELILILWALTREVRTMIPIAKSIESGRSISQALSEHAVWRHKIVLLTSFFNRTPRPLPFLHQILVQSKILDDCLKGRKPGNPWCGLFSLCLTLAGVGGLNV
jgi:DNA polymerase-3 subunit delta